MTVLLVNNTVYLPTSHLKIKGTFRFFLTEPCYCFTDKIPSNYLIGFRFLGGKKKKVKCLMDPRSPWMIILSYTNSAGQVLCFSLNKQKKWVQVTTISEGYPTETFHRPFRFSKGAFHIPLTGVFTWSTHFLASAAEYLGYSTVLCIDLIPLISL